jgi:cytochrome c oxidase subunit III
MSNAFQEPLRSGQVIDVETELSRNADRGDFPPATSVGPPLPLVADPAGEPVRTGVWIGLATISMMFAAFTSAAVVRKGSAEDWEHLLLPPILYLNTGVLLVSSFTLEIARRRVLAYARGEIRSPKIPLRWLGCTFSLGLIFVIGQLVAWSQLKAQGVYLASSPTSSFFYVMTVFHAVHVVGGLGGLVRVMLKLEVFTLRRSTLDGTAYYWHFMGALWTYLLLLLWLKF